MNKWLPLLALATLAVPAIAPAALSPTLAKSGASTLRAGQFLWDESSSGTGPLAIMVSIDRQHLYVYRGDTLIGVSTVSTGKPGKATPLGEFRILQKNVFHRSNIYSNAPMPYMQRLTWGGIAIHGGELPGYPASHGCIRVPLEFAKKLFAATDMGGIVSVSDGQSGPFLRVEVDMAALETDGRPAWTIGSQAVQFAANTLKEKHAPLPAVAVVRQSTTPTARPVRLALDEAALQTLAPTEVVTATAEPQPHWVVPYYADGTGEIR
ncbi:hypothetical protein C1T17_09960 [Sphingobium sp. SCG-1]|uniref:L,D-transpeptidase family protein n=1 Tax=Sphingobium sp. SCG-1 TaxID=2072936 RepID=UPI000CD69C58|nr:L,D-transpeptidase family protein [Sphingobium sp. SCG-1]AUW58379.1 hypothetical protein C1T17_09960 [Sphingobium sp. SCG-1]